MKINLTPKADVPNANGVIYPRQVLEKMVEDFNQNKAPMVFPMMENCLNEQDMSLLSHEITSLTMNEDGSVVGEMRILNTESGKALEQIIGSGSTPRFGISTRAKYDKDKIISESFVRVIGVVADTPTTLA